VGGFVFAFFFLILKAKSIQGSSIDYLPRLPSKKVESGLGKNKQRQSCPCSSREEAQCWCSSSHLAAWPEGPGVRREPCLLGAAVGHTPARLKAEVFV